MLPPKLGVWEKRNEGRNDLTGMLCWKLPVYDKLLTVCKSTFINVDYYHYMLYLKALVLTNKLSLRKSFGSGYLTIPLVVCIATFIFLPILYAPSPE